MGNIIYEKQPVIEYSESKINSNLLKKKGTYKTCSGIMLSDMQRFRKDGNFEMAVYCQEKYNQIFEIEKKKSQPIIEIEILEGWKGIDNIEIFKGFENDFIIKEHQKDKETGEVIESTHTIPYERVNTILFLIKQLKLGEKITYRKLVPKIIKIYDLQIGLDAFNGGKNRAKYYFPLYYRPVKILEALNLIKYSGRGDITRIK